MLYYSKELNQIILNIIIYRVKTEYEGDEEFGGVPCRATKSYARH